MPRFTPDGPNPAPTPPTQQPSSSHGSRSRAHGGAAPVGASVCLFALSGSTFALDVSCIGEVVQVERMIPIPLAPNAVVGLVNLRGVPLEILDPGRLLELTIADVQRTTVLVLQLGQMHAGVLVDRVEQVLAWERLQLLPRADDDHPMVAGIVEIPVNTQRASKANTATLLDPTWLAARLNALRMSHERNSETT